MYNNYVYFSPKMIKMLETDSIQHKVYSRTVWLLFKTVKKKILFVFDGR